MSFGGLKSLVMSWLYYELHECCVQYRAGFEKLMNSDPLFNASLWVVLLWLSPT